MNAQEAILNNIARIIDLEEDEAAYLLSVLKPAHFHRKQIVLREGEVCNTTFFVVSGCLRSYNIDGDGTEHVLSFAPASWWISDLYSLISGKPGVLFADALEETEAFALTKEAQEALFIRIPKFERFFRILIERSLVAYQQRLMDAVSLSAEARYLKFCSYYPALIDSLPQKQIASFIGVTPEFYSKMRSAVLRKS